MEDRERERNMYVNVNYVNVNYINYNDSVPAQNFVMFYKKNIKNFNYYCCIVNIIVVVICD